MKITAIKQQQKRADRYSIYVDGAYAFSLSEDGLIAAGLHSGQELDAVQLDALKQAAGLDKAYGNALRYVAMRPRSVGEMRQYLQRKKLDEAAAASIIQRLQAVQLLDDHQFARAWVANRRLLKSASRRRIMQELKQKQVAEDIIRQVLAADETDEHTALRQLAERKRRQLRYQDDQKLMQYLARQGYGFDDIKRALSELPAQPDTGAAD